MWKYHTAKEFWILYYKIREERYRKKDIGRLSLYAKREFVILRGRRIKNAKQEKDYEQ